MFGIFGYIRNFTCKIEDDWNFFPIEMSPIEHVGQFTEMRTGYLLFYEDGFPCVSRLNNLYFLTKLLIVMKRVTIDNGEYWLG